MHPRFLRSLAVWAALPLAALVLPALGMAAEKTAAEKTAAELFPGSVVAYAEIREPGKVLDLVLDHPLAKELIAQPEYQRVLQTPQYEQVLAALSQVEQRLGMKWRPAAGSLTSGGLFAGFDLPTQGVAVLAQAADEKVAEKARDTALELARSIAAASGRPDPIKQDEHRGITVHKIGEAYLAVLGKWLVVTNKEPLILMVVENYVAGGESLASDQQFQTVTKARTGQPAAWLYVDLRVLRLTGVLRQALNKKSDNPAAELLAGGVLGAIPDAPYVTASLDLSASRLKLTASLPCDPKAVAKSREFYLGPDASGTAPGLLRPSRTLLTLATYRDFASLWRHAPDLFDEGINAKFAEVESNLTTFFAGRNFRDEILGNLEPGLQLVVTRQEFPQGGVTPAIKLPAAAVVVKMKKPEDTARVFKMTFQSLVGFLNVVGAMNGVPPLDLNSEKVGGALVVSGEYLPPIKPEDRTAAALHFNASPTVAFVGDRFILASSRALAVELIEHVERELPPSKGVNTLVQVDAPAVQTILSENRGPLIARNMLDRGHDRQAAEQEIDRLLKTLLHVSQLSLQLTAEDARMQLALEVALTGGK